MTWVFMLNGNRFKQKIQAYCVATPPNLVGTFAVLPLQCLPATSSATTPSATFAPPYGKEMAVTGFTRSILDVTVISRAAKEAFIKWTAFGLCDKEERVLRVGVQELTMESVMDSWRCNLKTEALAISSIVVNLHIEGIASEPTFRVGAEPPTVDTLLHVCSALDRPIELEIVPVVRLHDSGMFELRYLLESVTSPYLEGLALSSTVAVASTASSSSSAAASSTATPTPAPAAPSSAAASSSSAAASSSPPPPPCNPDMGTPLMMKPVTLSPAAAAAVAAVHAARAAEEERKRKAAK